MSEDDIKRIYQQRYIDVLEPLALKLEKYILNIVTEYPRIDRVCVRSKSVSSFVNKATKLVDGRAKYTDPLSEIQDQLGARIITFYLSDLKPICTMIEKYFGPIEKRRIEPDNENEFGYEGFHFILFIPEDLFTPGIPRDECPKVFELQVKTLFQHAWAQANHDLAYKPLSELTKEQRRKVAFTAAQAWGADTIFNELMGSPHN